MLLGQLFLGVGLVVGFFVCFVCVCFVVVVGGDGDVAAAVLVVLLLLLLFLTNNNIVNSYSHFEQQFLFPAYYSTCT